jgi:squalene-associated FAD-dependent desaturase
MRHVAVIGAGFAGLAAAVALADRGVRVTVLEGRPHLGGRAYSFTDEVTGANVDNGQHAMMGCYTHTLSFLERIGAAGRLARQPNLHVEMRHPRLGLGSIACPALPSPLHMLGGILRYRLLSRPERRNALLGGLRLMAMRRRHDERLRRWTVADLLAALRQSPSSRANFWHPVAVATLNECAERAAASSFAEVLARAFFRTRTDSQFILPKVGLSQLYTEDARRFVERRGGRVETRAGVAALSLRHGRLEALELRDGRRIEFDACISSVPPRALHALLPPPLKEQLPFEHLDRFEVSPIVSAHLWLDRPVLRRDFVGLLDTTTQWIFNRSALTGETNGGGQNLSAVISAGREVVEWDATRIADTVVADIRRLVPEARPARVVRCVVVREKHATISPAPDNERRRPGPTTPIDNLFLAGDWIRTGLPATIESAVASAHTAAALVESRLRTPDASNHTLS